MGKKPGGGGGGGGRIFNRVIKMGSHIFEFFWVRQFFIFIVSKRNRMFVLQTKSKVFFFQSKNINGSIHKNRK